MAEEETTIKETHVEQTTTEKIEEILGSPLEIETREGRVKNRTVDEAIKADQYLSQKKASGAPWGIMFARTIYDGQYG